MNFYLDTQHRARSKASAGGASLLTEQALQKNKHCRSSLKFGRSPRFGRTPIALSRAIQSQLVTTTPLYLVIRSCTLKKKAGERSRVSGSRKSQSSRRDQRKAKVSLEDSAKFVRYAEILGSFCDRSSRRRRLWNGFSPATIDTQDSRPSRSARLYRANRFTAKIREKVVRATVN